MAVTAAAGQERRHLVDLMPEASYQT